MNFNIDNLSNEEILSLNDEFNALSCNFTLKEVIQTLKMRLKQRHYKTNQMRTYRQTDEGKKKVNDASKRWYWVKKRKCYHPIYNPTGAQPN